MDLLNQLDTELKNKHLNDFEKVRYIYLRTCELFSFDGKYYFPEFIKKEEYQKILYKKIDIANLSDFLVTCHSYSRDVLMRLINELTTAAVTLHDSVHSYVLYEEKVGHVWKLDATYGDFSRVKLRVNTNGFQSSTANNSMLMETDNSIGYEHVSKNNYLHKLCLESSDQLFKSINIMLLNSGCKYHYSDALYFIKWLLLGIMYPFSESNGIDDNYNFYHFFASDDSSLFYLSYSDGVYSIQKISKEKCLTLTRSINMSIENISNIREH